MLCYVIAADTTVDTTTNLNLYILNVVRCPYICTSVTVGVASSVSDDIIMRMTS